MIGPISFGLLVQYPPIIILKHPFPPIIFVDSPIIPIELPDKILKLVSLGTEQGRTCMRKLNQGYKN